MSDADGDSTMHSSPSDIDETEDLFPDEPAGHSPTTPLQQTSVPHSEISPPNSQGGPASASAFVIARNVAVTGSPSAGTINANGKRVMAEGRALGGGKEAKATGQPLGQSASGYTWTRPEDEPGYAWGNRKAMDEFQRAMEQIVDKETMIRDRYGDPCEDKR